MVPDYSETFPVLSLCILDSDGHFNSGSNGACDVLATTLSSTLVVSTEQNSPSLGLPIAVSGKEGAFVQLSGPARTAPA